jgi:hypothetical protein
MGHFAELFVFNDFNSISFRAFARPPSPPGARANDNRGPRCRCFLKNNIRRRPLWQETVGFFRAPLPFEAAGRARFRRLARDA